MSRKSKLVFSLVSLCFSIAVLCFGVYSALSVSYSISGNVSYEIKDVFVELDLSVYRALSTTPANSATHNQNVSTIKDAGDNISEIDFGKLSYTDHESTYEGEVVKPGNEDGIFEADSPNLALTYGSPTNDNQGYAFYIVIDIHNLGSEIINAQITAPTSLENTILCDSGNVEITADGTERIVLGLALDDVTTGITSADFTYTITISRGELPAEPITDMLFSVDEATKTATLISYTGSGGDVVIPETIGYVSPSSMILTFNTMEDMTSNEMNMGYFYQDLYITLPNQEVQLIENPMLWLNENRATIQATPEDYFPMTIQTVDSYTIDQEEYATLGQEGGNFVLVPIQMIIEGLLYNSVDVQYGTEGRSFTFNMENYNAAMGNDESTTSLAIQDFISKAYSAPESLLPVTFSNFEYGFAVKGKEYFVTSIGEDAFRDCSSLTSIEIPSSVTSIGSSAFRSCSNLTSIEIPSSVTSIGISAFASCSNLTSIEIPSSVTSIGGYAFNNCSSLTSIEIPSSVTSIGYGAFSGTPWLTNLQNTSYGIATASDGQTRFVIDVPPDITDDELDMTNVKVIAGGAFNNCSNLTSITIPSSVTSIDSLAFSDCSSLTSIEIPSSVTSIGSSAFESCSNLTSIKIPSSVTSIGDGAFNNCDALETVTFGGNSQLESIGSNAFRYCSNLTSIEIPSSVTSIGDDAFYYCDALETVTFGENSQLGSIGSDAFLSCSNLTSIEIPSSVTSIGENAFLSCSNLTSIEIPSSVKSIGDNAFYLCKRLESIAVDPNNANYCNDEYGVLFNKDKTELIQYPIGNTRTQYTIPSSVTSIVHSAFDNCSALKTVTFGENSQLESIGYFAFRYCSNLTSIDIPSSVTSIGEGAFYDCSSLTSIEIPSGVTSIGSSAFWDCSALETVTFGENSQLESISSSAFRNCTNLTSIEIPSSVTSIGNSAFEGCINLTSIEIPSSVTSIEDSAFYNCLALKTVTFGENSQLESIGYSTFRGCSNLTSIKIPSSVTSIGFSAFSGCYALAEIYNYSTHIPQVTIGNSSSSTNGYLGQYAKVVYNPSDLTGEKPATRIQTWGDVQYYVYGEDFIALAPSVARDSLTTLTLDGRTTEINRYAFEDCFNLTSIEIPSSVTSIGSYAFSYCSALQTVTFEDTNSIWLLSNTSNTEITVSEHSPQELATYLTSAYDNYTWTKKQ